MLVIGNKIVYPSGNTKVKVREYGNKVIFYQTKPSGHRDIIILAKDGNHLKAGLEYAKNYKRKSGVLHAWGTLKTHDVKTKHGVMHKGFMRDVAVTYENPLDAMTDNRYKVDEIISADDYDGQIDDFIADVQKTNGVAALILTEY